jgi:hypothetical protein
VHPPKRNMLRLWFECRAMAEIKCVFAFNHIGYIGHSSSYTTSLHLYVYPTPWLAFKPIHPSPDAMTVRLVTRRATS